MKPKTVVITAIIAGCAAGIWLAQPRSRTARSRLAIAPADRPRFAALLLRDRKANLVERLAYFREKNSVEADAFDFLPKVIERGFVACAFRRGPKQTSDLIYSVGFLYTYDWPEVLIVGEGDVVDLDRLYPIIDDIGRGLPREAPIPRDERPGRLRKLVRDAAAKQRLEVEEVPFSTAELPFVEMYPYGYGMRFYELFMDARILPIMFRARSK